MPPDYKVCPKCRAQVPSVAKICATCGSALPKPEPAPRAAADATKECPSCRSMVPAAAKICPSCNSYLTIAQPRPRTAPAAGTSTAMPRQQNPFGGFILLLVLVGAGWFGYHAWAQNAAHHASTPLDGSDVGSASTPQDGRYTGKVADLPEPAQALLRFEPVSSEDQVNSESIATRVEQYCGEATAEYVGADDFPGTITVEDAAHGASRISWSLENCARNSTLGAIVGTHPTFVFQISHDEMNLRSLNQAAYWAAN